MTRALLCLAAAVLAGCSSIPVPREPGPVSGGEGLDVAVSAITVSVAAEDVPKGYAPKEFIDLRSAGKDLARWIASAAGVGSARAVNGDREAALDDAWAHREDLVVGVRLEELRCRFKGHNEWWIPNILNWLFWIVPAWFVATEEYELAFDAHLEIRSVDSGRVLSSDSFALSAEGTMDEFDRGWQFFGWIWPNNDADNWRQIGGLLAPAAMADLGAEVSARVEALARDLLEDGSREQLNKTLGLFVGVSHHEDPAVLPPLLAAAPDAEAVRAAFSTPRGVAIPKRQTRLLANSKATRAGLDAALAELSSRARAGDQLVVYFAGYGTRTAAGQPALVLHELDGAGQPVTLPVAELLAALPADVRSLVVLEAAFDGQRRSLGAEGGAPPAFEPARSDVSLVLATSPGAPLWEAEHVGGGLLAHHLVRAFEGAADQDGDGELSLAELTHHIKERVVVESAYLGSPHQRPQVFLSEERFALPLGSGEPTR